jgi:glucan phosphoethanolaminetransferase (alkaline phosphatase superfamily)
MEAMYTLGLEIHTVGVMVLMGVVMFNIMMLLLSKNIIRYAQRMRIVMPVAASLIALILLTGAIMMAAKHLHFTFANDLMIIAGIAFIVLEAKRYSTLKRRTDIRKEEAFEGYKRKALTYLGIEMGLLVGLTLLMIIPLGMS